jgi:hypothetical protein
MNIAITDLEEARREAQQLEPESDIVATQFSLRVKEVQRSKAK